jgi:hypothetical protein
MEMETTNATMTMAAVTAAMMTTTTTTTGGGSGQMVTAVTDGSMVWGRGQAAGGGRNGNKAEMGTM